MKTSHVVGHVVVESHELLLKTSESKLQSLIVEVFRREDIW